PFPRPLGVSLSVGISDLDDRILFAPFEVGVRPLRVTPICALLVAPPLKVIIKANRGGRWGKYGRARDEVFRWRRGIFFLCGRDLGYCAVTCSFNEFLELLI